MSDAHLSRRIGCELRCTHYPSPQGVWNNQTWVLACSTKVYTEDRQCRALPVSFVGATPGCRTQPSDLAWIALIHQHREACPTPPSVFKHADQSLIATGATQCWVKTKYNVTVTAFPWEPAHVNVGKGWWGCRLPLQELHFSYSRHKQHDGRIIHRRCTVRHRRDIYLFLITNNVLHWQAEWRALHWFIRSNKKQTSWDEIQDWFLVVSHAAIPATVLSLMRWNRACTGTEWVATALGRRNKWKDLHKKGEMKWKQGLQQQPFKLRVTLFFLQSFSLPLCLCILREEQQTTRKFKGNSGTVLGKPPSQTLPIHLPFGGAPLNIASIIFTSVSASTRQTTLAEFRGCRFPSGKRQLAQQCLAWGPINSSPNYMAANLIHSND